jgi:predicted AlkP superfamily phosphohydrolase/phosphomutase
LWQELAEAGRRVAVLNFPTGYPPAPIKNGYFTAGGPGAKDRGFACPLEWESVLRQRFAYRVHPRDVLSSAQQVAVRLDEILSVMQSRFDVAFDLLDRGLDFLHITIFYSNVLHHFWYQGEPSRAGWRLIDQNLGRLHRIAVERGYNLLLMSDHGCGPVDTIFYVNTWLEQHGYLKLKSSKGPRLSKWGLNRERAIGLARRSGLAPILRRVVPKQWRRALPSAGGTYGKAAKGERIDWECSLAVASGQGPVYLLRSPDDPNYERVRTEIAEGLETLRNPVTRQPLITRVMCREDIYDGPFLKDAPDLVFEQGVGVHTSGGVGYSKIFRAPEKWAADNVLEGLFLASGPDFAPIGRVERTSILDLAPTILHTMGMLVPEKMDGRVLLSLFAPESDSARRSVQFHSNASRDDINYTDEDQAEIADRLSALGYLE